MEQARANAAWPGADPECRRLRERDIPSHAGPPRAAPAVHLIARGSLEVAEALCARGFRPCVLNFANNEVPGGPTQLKGHTQEEVLMRRTTLSAGLAPALYPLDVVDDRTTSWDYRELGLALSPRVHLVRDAGGAWTGPVAEFAVVSCAAVKLPWTAGGRYRSEADRDVTRRKIGMILDAALGAGHRHLVAGQWGCGAFANPPEICELWADAIRARPISVVFPVFSAAFGRELRAACAAPAGIEPAAGRP